jgi:1,4-dihydroxy-2-naphthoate octaprenyltransferase
VVNRSQDAPAGLSRAQVWVLACRPKTLPAAVVPVVVGSALAWADESFAALPAAFALVCALLIQIGTNLANDYFDFMKGADTAERIGPARVTQSGLVAPATVRRAMIGVFAATFILGLYLVARGGWPVLAIGVASILCAVLYTAGPYPLAYLGLGDAFVFLFFGLVAVGGTYFVQSRHWSAEAFFAAVPIGAITTAILVVNNYRDIDTDRVAGKRTLAVRFGRRASRWEYAGLLAVAYVVPVLQLARDRRSPWILLPLLSIPLAVRVLRVLHHPPDGAALNGALAATGRLLAAYGALYATALVVS